MLYGTVPTPPSLSAGEKVLLIHYDVVSSSHTLNLVKLPTPNSSSASSTTPRESIPIPIRPRPTSGRTFSFLEACGTLQAGVAWSKVQTRHHFITRVESDLDHLVVRGCESYISSKFLPFGGPSENKNPPLLIGSFYVFLLIKPSVGWDMDNRTSWLGYPYVHE